MTSYDTFEHCCPWYGGKKVQFRVTHVGLNVRGDDKFTVGEVGVKTRIENEFTLDEAERLEKAVHTIHSSAFWQKAISCMLAIIAANRQQTILVNTNG